MNAKPDFDSNRGFIDPADEYDETENRITDLEADIADLQHRLKDAERPLRERIEELDGAMNRMGKEVEMLERFLVDKDARIQELEAQLAKRETDIQLIEAVSDARWNDLQIAQTRIAELESQLSKREEAPKPQFKVGAVVLVPIEGELPRVGVICEILLHGVTPLAHIQGIRLQSWDKLIEVSKLTLLSKK